MEFIDTIPLSSGCEAVAAHPCGLIAINKKAGRAAHPNPVGEAGKPPMLRAKYNFDGEYYSWLDEDGAKRRLYLVNRLDSPTSGVVIASENEDAAILAREQFKLKNVKKIYYAIVLGKIYPHSDLWKDRLETRKSGGHLRSARAEGGNSRLAMLKYTVEEFDENGVGLSLLKLEPSTGITHQLRVQCAARAHPILGDATYGNFQMNKRIKAASKISRLFLHCAATAINFEMGGEAVEFSAEAPLPESFNKIIKFNSDIKKSFF